MARHSGAETASAAQPRKARRPMDGLFMVLRNHCPDRHAMPRVKTRLTDFQQGPPTRCQGTEKRHPANNPSEKSLANALGRSLIEVVPRTPFAQAASCRHAQGPMCHRGGHAGWRGTRQFPSSGKEGGLWVEFVPCVAQGPPLFLIRRCRWNWRHAHPSPSSSCGRIPHAVCPTARRCGHQNSPAALAGDSPAGGRCGIRQKTPALC